MWQKRSLTKIYFQIKICKHKQYLIYIVIDCCLTWVIKFLFKIQRVEVDILYLLTHVQMSCSLRIIQLFWSNYIFDQNVHVSKTKCLVIVFIFLKFGHEVVFSSVSIQKSDRWYCSPRFLCRLTSFCSTCWNRGTTERSP
jgi:hypothetical protein